MWTAPGTSPSKLPVSNSSNKESVDAVRDQVLAVLLPRDRHALRGGGDPGRIRIDGQHVARGGDRDEGEGRPPRGAEALDARRGELLPQHLHRSERRSD